MSVYKYAHWSFGDIEALINVLGEENALGLKSGNLTVECVGSVLRIKKAVRPLFDKNGRRIPPRGLAANVRNQDREFHLVQPAAIDYAARLNRLAQLLPPKIGLATANGFAERSKLLLAQIKADPQLANILKGVHLPIAMPHIVVSDYGKSLDEFFIPAASQAYALQFPGQTLRNCQQGELQSQVLVVGGSRHEQLLTIMAACPVVGIYFPNPFQGYSVHAQREQMATLPESFLLTGGLDTATAWVMYPDVLARDFETPVYHCAALQWQSSECSLCFEAKSDRASFVADMSSDHEVYSGGLLFLG